MGYANFWKRLWALLLDQLIVLLLCLPFLALISFLGSGNNAANDIGDMLIGAIVLVGWLYYAKQESSKKQATIGKSILGIKITDYSGNTISFKRASIRYFSKILSGIIYGIGYFMAGFTKRKQGLHDIIAKTLVVQDKTTLEFFTQINTANETTNTIQPASINIPKKLEELAELKKNGSLTEEEFQMAKKKVLS